MNHRIAILDLGTNTFHLLIAEYISKNTFEICFKAEEYVQLGEEGVERIGDKAFSRGLNQIRKYKAVIDKFQTERVIAFGTAAIRSASNADDFVQQIKAICPMELKKISGDEEAEYIYFGVRQAVPLSDDPVLIMDIGGGSTEFIIANKDDIFWKQSFPVGASVLMKRFHHHEPIAPAEVAGLIEFLNTSLQPLFMQQNNYAITRLVGASGSFDTFASLVSEKDADSDFSPLQTGMFITADQLKTICDRLIKSNEAQRLNMKGMKAFRAPMMTIASILTQDVVEQFHIESIMQSAYALKEGVLWQWMQEWRC